MLPSACAPLILMPSPRLPEMTLRAVSVVPPTMLLKPSTIRTPAFPLPKSSMPLAVVPTKLPWSIFPDANSPEMRTPLNALAEMMLSVNTFPGALSTKMPSARFGNGPSPSALVPIKLFRTELPVAVDPLMSRPTRLPEMRLSSTTFPNASAICTPSVLPISRLPLRSVPM